MEYPAPTLGKSLAKRLDNHPTRRYNTHMENPDPKSFAFRLRATIALHPESPLPTESLLALCKRGGRYRLSADGRLTAALTPEEGATPEAILQAVSTILSQLQALLSAK